MREPNEGAETDESAPHMEAPSPAAKQPFVGILVAAAVLITVMVLMLLAVRQSASVGGRDSRTQPLGRSEGVSPGHYARHIVVERFVIDLRTSVAGTRGLEIRGYVRNTGRLPVSSADLKCFFRTKTGSETAIELPLVIDSALEEVSEGPLMPLSRREFGLRIGEFPYDLEPEIMRMEPVNVRVLTQL